MNDIHIELVWPSGALRLTSLGDERMTMLYIGYTPEEAIERFTQEMNA